MLLGNVSRARAAQRQRRSPPALAARRARAPRLRAGQTDRPPLRWRAQVPRRVAVSDALSSGAPRSHPGSMDREEWSTPEALLPSNRGRTENAGLAAAELDGVLRCAEPRRTIEARVKSVSRQST